MRPAGIIRQAVSRTAWELAVERASTPTPGATFRDIADRLAPLGFGRQAVRNTVKNLARSGAFCPVGPVRATDSMRELVAYAPAQLVPAPPAVDLGAALRCWVPAASSSSSSF